MNKTPQVFVSYSRRDEEWKNRLLKHLEVALDRRTLDVWDDTRIPAGSAWREELEGALQRADLAILLISSDFLASNFIREVEVPALLDRSREGQLEVVPVLVRPCAWQSVEWMRDHQVFPKDGEALSAGDENEIESDLANVVQEVDKILKAAG